MAVIGERFVYDVSDPIRPRLICSATNSEVHVVSKTAVAYTTTIDGRVVVVRRDLASHADTVVGSYLSILVRTPSAFTLLGSPTLRWRCI